MEHGNLFIGGLPDGIDDQSFAQLFEGSGTIISCKCVPEKKYGFVKYASVEEAGAVAAAMNGFDFNGTTLTVRFANADAGKGGSGKGDKGDKGGKKGKDAGGWNNSQPQFAQAAVEEVPPSDNLYMKGLPPDMTEAMVDEIFGSYATVTSKRLLKHPNGSALLLRVATTEMATWMVDNLNGNIPQGLVSPVEVRFADTPSTKARKMQALVGMPAGGMDMGDMGGMGGKGDDFGFGPTKGDGKGKGKGKGPYGKAQFGNVDPNLPEEVKSCVETVLANFGAGGRPRFPPEGDASNLYVKDLPGTADELYIYKVFAPFGPLESITLKKGDGGTWAIGFVKYMSNEGASRALMGLTNCLLPDGSMPKVSIKSKN